MEIVRKTRGKNYSKIPIFKIFGGRPPGITIISLFYLLFSTKCHLQQRIYARLSKPHSNFERSALFFAQNEASNIESSSNSKIWGRAFTKFKEIFTGNRDYLIKYWYFSRISHEIFENRKRSRNIPKINHRRSQGEDRDLPGMEKL